MVGGIPSDRSGPLGGLRRPVLISGFVSLTWAAVLLAWAAYSCFVQVGFGTYAQGIFYYGSTGGTANADTGSLAYGILYAVFGLLILRGTLWARAFVLGLVAVDGYNRLRSLTGALFDPVQRRWYTGQTEGVLHLITLCLGLCVAIGLTALLVRRLTPEEPRWTPEPNRWTQAAQAVQAAQQAQQALPTAPSWNQQPQQAAPWSPQPPQPQPAPGWNPQAGPVPQPVPGQQPAPFGQQYPQAQPPQPGQPLSGQPLPGQPLPPPWNRPEPGYGQPTIVMQPVASSSAYPPPPAPQGGPVQTTGPAPSSAPQPAALPAPPTDPRSEDSRPEDSQD